MITQKDKVSVVFLSKDTDENKILKNVRESPYNIFAIRLVDYTEKTEELAADICNFLHNRDKKVFLEVLSYRGLSLCLDFPSVVYITEQTKNLDISRIIDICIENKIKIVYRIHTDKMSESEIISSISFFNGLIRDYSLSYFFIRTDNINLDKLIEILQDNLKTEENVYLLDAPLCAKNKTSIRLTSSALFDLNEQIDNSGITKEYDKKRYLKEFKKTKNPCLSCSLCHTCFGMKRSSVFTEMKASENFSYDASLTDILTEPNTGVITFNPEKPENFGNEVLASLNKNRILKNFEGGDFYYIWDFKNSFYFNRPLNPCVMWQKDPRGIMSINWQFIGADIPELQWKSKCDLLVPTHGVVTTVRVKFDERWSEKRQRDLDNLTFSTIKEAILKNGGDPQLLEQKGNDLLYRGKKFAGKEWKLAINMGYLENVVLTCEYEKEKEWFDKLYHWPGEKQITGITDEVPTVTKDILIEALYKKSQEFFNE